MATSELPRTPDGRTGPPAAANGRASGPAPPEEPAFHDVFDGDRLYGLRSAVAAHAADLGAGERTDDVVLVAHELAGNAVRHGGGRGRIWLWRAGRDLYCRIADGGTGMSEPDTAGTVRPRAGVPGGRGLFIVRQMVDRLQIHCDGGGTTITAVVELG